jgi:hypothetical protein
MDDQEEIDNLRRQIHNSSAMTFIHRMRIRSSCLRMFTMNAYRLEDAFLSVQEKRLQLASDDSGDIFRQCNLALNYLLHNFLASAKTLVDHTRIFVADFYARTPAESSYNAKIASEIASDKVCRFVHDLRNYMLHCGMPHLTVWSSIDMHSEISSGVYLYVRDIKEWSGWTALSKQFLTEQRDTVDPDDIARHYCHKIIGFHTWFDQYLTEYHKDQLAELEDLRARLRALSDHPHDAAQRNWDDWRAKIDFNALPWRAPF